MLEGKDLVGHKVYILPFLRVFNREIGIVRMYSKDDLRYYVIFDGLVNDYCFKREGFTVLTDSPLGRAIYGQD